MFHGGLPTPGGQNYSKTRGKILIMHESAESAIPMDVFAGLAKELESAGVSHEMISYGGARTGLAFSVRAAIRKQRTENPGNAFRNFWPNG